MKIQDILFLLVLFALIYKRNPKWAVLTGLGSLILSIPLFATWTFFTAERMTWYAAGFFLVAIVFHLIHKRNEQ